MGTASRISDLQQRAQDGRRRSRAAASGCPGSGAPEGLAEIVRRRRVSMIGQRPGVAVTDGWTAAMPAGRRCSRTTEKVFGAFCITALHGDEQRLRGAAEFALPHHRVTACALWTTRGRSEAQLQSPAARAAQAGVLPGHRAHACHQPAPDVLLQHVRLFVATHCRLQGRGVHPVLPVVGFDTAASYLADTSDKLFS